MAKAPATLEIRLYHLQCYRITRLEDTLVSYTSLSLQQFPLPH